MRSIRLAVALAVSASLFGLWTTSVTAATEGPDTQRGAASPVEFKLVRSSTTRAADCIDGARARAEIRQRRGIEIMTLSARGLPARTTFVVWINQIPDAPFGISWYLGDMTTDADGTVSETFRGRFSIESFAVAPGVTRAPVIHPNGMFPDASKNPSFAPVHMHHVGLWFESPADAAAAGCPDAQTPFNGDHTAGVQAMSTRNYPNRQGPLQLVPGG